MQYEVKKTIAEISSTGSTAKRLTLTRLKVNPDKLVLRICLINGNGDSQPGN